MEYEYYIKRFNIDLEKAEKKALVKNYNGTRTAAKEMIGDAAIKEFHLFDKLFPGNTGYKKVTNKKLQKSGADYEVYFEDEDPIYVDLKSCVGEDYSMKEEDFDTVEKTDTLLSCKGATIEIYQNNIFTFTKDKITDFVLFLFFDNSGIYYYNMLYSDIRQAALKHKNEYIKVDDTIRLRKDYPYKRYVSNNGSGLYIKYPVFTTKLERRIEE